VGLGPGLSLRSPRDDGGFERAVHCCIVDGMAYFVYMLASRRHGTLYLGITNDLSRRVSEHKAKTIAGFSAKYSVDRLVWYETYDRVDEAIAREKSLKKWRRDWKIRLIEEMNPDWSDLYRSLNR
jgi:putative endonuclease